MFEVSSKEAARDFSTLASRVGFGHERIVVTRNGRPLVAIVSVADLQRLEQRGVVQTRPTEPPR